MNRGRTSVRSPLATYSIHSTSYTSPTAASYSLHTPSYSPHITSYTSKGNLYPYNGKTFSSNESIRTNSNGDNRTPQVLTLPLTFAYPRCPRYPRYPRSPRYISQMQMPRSRSVDPALVREAAITRQLIESSPKQAGATCSRIARYKPGGDAGDAAHVRAGWRYICRCECSGRAGIR